MRAVPLLARFLRSLLMVTVLSALAACGGRFFVDYDAPLSTELTGGIRVSTVNVAVPADLTVSEANILIPNADIVWHGEPFGDRRAQVAAIVETSARQAVAPLRGSRRAALNITMQQFHAETPAAILRAPSAVHSVRFTAQIVDAVTGQAITPPTAIKADLSALVGEAALAMQRQTGGPFLSYQKTRITGHITAVLRGWLGVGPDIRGSFTSLGR